MSGEAIAIIGVGVALLAVLVPMLRGQERRIDRLAADVGGRLDRTDARIDAVAAGVGALRGEVAELRRDLHAVAERVARIEGALTGPWRPTNGGTTVPAGAEQPPTAEGAR